MTTPSRVALVLSAFVAVTVLPNQAAAAPGDLDPRFGVEGRVVRKDLAPAHDVVIQRDRKTVLLGPAVVDGNPGIYVARLLAGGRLDRRFATRGKRTIALPGSESPAGLALDDRERIVVGFDSNPREAEQAFGVARLRPNGNLDRSFDGDGVQTAGFGTGLSSYGAGDVTVTQDGKIVVAGTVFNQDGYHADFGVIRFGATGQLDESFADDGRQVTDFRPGQSEDDRAFAVTIDSQGRAVVGGSTGARGCCVDPIALARYDQAGELDESFAGDGTLISDLAPEATDIVAVGGDRIAVAGETAGDFLVARFDADGTPDTSFSDDGAQAIDFDDGPDQATSIARSGPKLVVAGNARSARRGTNFGLARLQSDGDLDRRFGNGGRRSIDFARRRDEAAAVAVHHGSDIVVGGSVEVPVGERAGLVRVLGRGNR